MVIYNVQANGVPAAILTVFAELVMGSVMLALVNLETAFTHLHQMLLRLFHGKLETHQMALVEGQMGIPVMSFTEIVAVRMAFVDHFQQIAGLDGK